VGAGSAEHPLGEVVRGYIQALSPAPMVGLALPARKYSANIEEDSLDHDPFCKGIFQKQLLSTTAQEMVESLLSRVGKQ
jgi:hypothetical protein